MKQVNFSGLFSIWILRLAICASLVFGAQQSLGASEADGRLIVKRSPTLGYNVVVAVTIDGKPAGSLTRGRTLETHLAPGSHIVSASPGNGETAWRETLNVRGGETYTYTASYTVNLLKLTPTPSR